MVVLSKHPSTIDENDLEDDEELDTIGNDSESDQESESNDEAYDIKLTEPSKTAIYNKDGLLDKLGDISWLDNVDWMHTLSIVINQEQEVEVNDDLAQMVKTDSHMEKVKSKLLVEKKQREEQDERRKAREAKRIAKQVEAEKLKERVKEEKEQIESVKKWRKQRQRSGFTNDKDEMKLSFEEGGAHEGKRKGLPGVRPGDRSSGKGRQFGGKGKKGMNNKRKNREFRDSKFGFGGRKGGKRQNTAETTNDIRGFNNNSRFWQKENKAYPRFCVL